jgi:hypothetical protein
MTPHEFLRDWLRQSTEDDAVAEATREARLRRSFALLHPDPKELVTLLDIAADAGVSWATVSLVIAMFRRCAIVRGF